MADSESFEDVGENAGDAGKGGISRKKFITLASFGAAGAVAALALQRRIPSFSSRRKIKRVVGNKLPGKGSIFQPRNPPKA
ncbi:MAG: hypothetical protein IIB28_08280 [Chloroflexi bacterium]|nr:hypothetical protein [Chloroflexota bacterium]